MKTQIESTASGAATAHDNAPLSITDIKHYTEAYALQHSRLADALADFQAGIKKLTERFGPIVQEIHAQAATAKLQLATALQENPELFVKPRTYVFDDIKVGYQKQKGKIIIADEEFTIGKLEALLGNVGAADYFKVNVSIDKTKVDSLPGDTLKKCGIQVTADTNAILIKPVNDIQRAVEALLTNPIHQAA